MTNPTATTPTGSPRDPAKRRGIDILLSDHHRRLETKCREMLEWAHTDSTRDLGAAWCEMESELLDHMVAEEEVILPTYEIHAPNEARRIRDDHDRIRALVTAIGIDLELHEIRLGHLRRLVEALDAHSLAEDATMYPWAVANIDIGSQRLLVTRIGRWLVGD